jgi:hypothetical protein
MMEEKADGVKVGKMKMEIDLRARFADLKRLEA